MPEPDKTKLQSIEAARGVAACMVVVYHAARQLGQNGAALPSFFGLERFGHAGVDFFFVLSGFIILFVHRSDIGSPHRLAHYLERRLTRIFPLYWIVLAATIALGFVAAHALPAVGELVQAFALTPLHHPAIVGVSWTLQHEMIFYAAFAVLMVNRRAGLALLALWLMAIAAARIGLVDPEHVGAAAKIFATFNVQFFIGMAAALLVRRWQVPAPGLVLGVGASLLVVSGLGEAADLFDGFGHLARLLYGAAAGVVVVGLIGCERQALITVPPVMKMLGKASYSIYLTHFITIGIALRAVHAAGLPSSASMVTLILVAIAVGVGVSMLIEYPAMRLARRLFEPAHLARAAETSPAPLAHRS